MAVSCILSRLFLEILLQEDGISGVAFVQSVGQVADKGYQADDKVEHNIHDHLKSDVAWQASVDFRATCDDHQG
jgi:hypothetical protein